MGKTPKEEHDAGTNALAKRIIRKFMDEIGDAGPDECEMCATLKVASFIIALLLVENDIADESGIDVVEADRMMSYLRGKAYAAAKPLAEKMDKSDGVFTDQPSEGYVH